MLGKARVSLLFLSIKVPVGCLMENPASQEVAPGGPADATSNKARASLAPQDGIPAPRPTATVHTTDARLSPPPPPTTATPISHSTASTPNHSPAPPPTPAASTDATSRDGDWILGAIQTHKVTLLQAPSADTTAPLPVLLCRSNPAARVLCVEPDALTAQLLVHESSSLSGGRAAYLPHTTAPPAAAAPTPSAAPTPAPASAPATTSTTTAADSTADAASTALASTNIAAHPATPATAPALDSASPCTEPTPITSPGLADVDSDPVPASPPVPLNAPLQDPGPTYSYGAGLTPLPESPPPPPRLQYTSVDHLLQLHERDPDPLRPYTHVFLDDAHVRTVPSELLLLLLRRALARRPALRLILTAPAVPPDLRAYFPEFDPHAVTVPPPAPGPPPPLYLEDLPTQFPSLAASEALRDAAQMPDLPAPALRPAQHALLQQVLALLPHAPGHCTVVYVPTAHDAARLRAALADAPYEVLAGPEVTAPRLLRPPPGDRARVVLTTAAALPPVPPPDCVLDCGLVAALHADPLGRPAPAAAWTPAPLAARRAAPRGRTLRLYPTAQPLPPHAPPALPSAPVPYVVLAAFPALVLQDNPKRLLAGAPAPPAGGRAAADAAEVALRDLWALCPDRSRTAVGDVAARVPALAPALARLVVLCHAAGLLAEGVALAAALAQPDLFPVPDRAPAPTPDAFACAVAAAFAARAAADAGRYSEALTALDMYGAWLRGEASGISAARARAADRLTVQFCDELLRDPDPGCPPLPLRLTPADASRLRTLRDMAVGAGPALGRASGGARDAPPDLFSTDADLLRFIIGAAFAPQWLESHRPPAQPVDTLAAIHGMDPLRTALLQGIPNGCTAPQLQAAVAYPQCQAQRVVLVPGLDGGRGAALVELAPSPAPAPQAPVALQDTDIAPKLLKQLVSLNGGTLPLPGAPATAGLPVDGVALPQELWWKAGSSRARLNPRAPLGAVSDLRAANHRRPPEAVAAMLLPGEAAGVYATGVTLLPEAWAAVLRIIAAPHVAKVKCSTTPETRMIGEAQLQTSVQDSTGAVITLPTPLTMAAWAQVNALRRALGAALATGDAGGADVTAALRALAAAQDVALNPRLYANRQNWKWRALEREADGDAAAAPAPAPLPPLRVTDEVVMAPADPAAPPPTREERKSQRRDVEYDRLRQSVKLALTLHPEGMTVRDFSEVRGVCGKKGMRRRALLGYTTLRATLESMPDVIRVIDAPHLAEGYYCVPVARGPGRGPMPPTRRAGGRQVAFHPAGAPLAAKQRGAVLARRKVYMELRWAVEVVLEDYPAGIALKTLGLETLLGERVEVCRRRARRGPIRHAWVGHLLSPCRDHAGPGRPGPRTRTLIPQLSWNTPPAPPFK